MTTKERLHQLIEELPEDAWPATERFLTDPLLQALLCSPEGEPPLSPEEIAGILAGERDIAAGRTRRFSDLDEAIRWLEEEEEEEPA